MRTLRSDIQAVFDRDPAARRHAGSVVPLSWLHAIWLHRLARAFWV